jgi:adenosylcobyric acid synthase
MGDLVADHLDTVAVSRLITGGPPPGLPVIPPAGVMPPQAPPGPAQAGRE